MNSEIERLKKVYPLFQFEPEGENLKVTISRGHTFHPRFTNNRIDHEATRMLDHEHMQKSMSKDLMSLYPDLFISVYAGHKGCTASVWISRKNEAGEDDDAEAIGNVSLTSFELHNVLGYWQSEAAQAKKDGWFFCSGHVKAEPKSEYGYFYFAGRYCKKWGEENPEHREMAGKETYN